MIFWRSGKWFSISALVIHQMFRWISQIYVSYIILLYYVCVIFVIQQHLLWIWWLSNVVIIVLHHKGHQNNPNGNTYVIICGSALFWGSVMKWSCQLYAWPYIIKKKNIWIGQCLSEVQQKAHCEVNFQQKLQILNKISAVNIAATNIV